MILGREFDEWLSGMDDDERGLISTADAFEAGARAMFAALVGRGYIDDDLPGGQADRARRELELVAADQPT